MSDVIERKKLIEEIQLIAKELNKDKQNAEPDDSDLILAVDNQLSAIWRIKGIINNQPQVQLIVRQPLEDIALYMSNDCEDCPCCKYEQCKHEALPDDDLSDVCMKHRIDWLTGKEV